MKFTYEPYEKQGNTYLEITGVDGNVEFLTVPEEIDGLPVRSIGAHAFERRESLREVTIPESVDTIRAFALYSCPNLEKITLYNTVKDYYDGVIRRCSSLRDIHLICRSQDFAVMKSMLEDSDMQLLFTLDLPDGKARLTFPSYEYGFEENTFARTIQFRYEGTGFTFRSYVYKNRIDYKWYDRLFPRVVHSDPEAAALICVDRLMYPYELREEFRTQYETYLNDKAENILTMLVEKRDVDRISFVTETGDFPKEALDVPIRLASGMKQTEICGILMEYQRKHSGTEAPGAGMFSLDDLW